MRGAHSAFLRLLQEFKRQSSAKDKELNIDAECAVMITENWKLYKKDFPVNKVVLIGENTDFYNVYCIDSTNHKSLLFDLKSSKNINDISIVNEQSIYIGNSTQQVSVPEAINLLENCIYAPPSSKPNEEKFKELIELLKLNI